ncbi:uncharacterized protein ARMOST_16139 [Armillaria ostoyae]|uniref:Uncharacterized protein n=1 Tax=Armillaria ostoyae TaxID=47428 RepID=A0A284RVC3_ARMOS|nr:uncharacterized protein ARMOST_16139 [Armillaria ostoyae]
MTSKHNVLLLPKSAPFSIPVLEAVLTNITQLASVTAQEDFDGVIITNARSCEAWDKANGITREDFLDSDFTIPNSYTVRECIRGQGWTSTGSGGGFPAVGQRYSAHTSFDQPLNPETLFLLSQGSLSSGAVKVATFPTLKDDVRVGLAILHYRQKVLARICLLQRREGENGVARFTLTHTP